MIPILHHYDFSNFSEKVRLMFGFKNAPWHSVEIPAYLPKPDYTPLTGGYRRTPALQIGADVYCDTRLIGEVLEERYRKPSFFPGGRRDRSLCFGIAAWAETRLLWPAALYITGLHAERFPDAFHSDRARLHRKPKNDLAKVKASAARYLAQLQSELAEIENLFDDDNPFVLGSGAGLADFSLYHVPWFLDTIDPSHGLLNRMPKTRAWMARVAAIGHGTFETISSREAIAVAAANVPVALAQDGVDTLGPERISIGERVTVSPLDEDAPAVGVLVGLDDRRISLAVDRAQGFRVHVHFPRSGYKLSRSGGR